MDETGYGLRRGQLAGYAALMSVFTGLVAAFATWFRRSGRELPERLDARDLALLTVASARAARIITKDRVTSPLRAPLTHLQGPGGPGEVEEEVRVGGFAAALGDLVVCPYCIAMWMSAFFAAGMLVAPRLTRFLASVLTIFFGADFLQIVYRRAENSV